MRIISRKLLTASLLVSFVFVPLAALAGYREDMHVTAIEIAQLPPFCWMQFEVPNVKGEEFRIRDCGVAANHYCPGLLYLIRAKGHVSKGERWAHLSHADTDIRYTERAIADSPRCSIRDHVAASRTEVNNLMILYGYNRPRAK